jgi:hypothetical protein
VWLFNDVLKFLSVYSVVCRVCGVTNENDLRRCVTDEVAAFTGCSFAVDEDLPTFSSKILFTSSHIRSILGVHPSTSRYLNDEDIWCSGKSDCGSIEHELGLGGGFW